MLAVQVVNCPREWCCCEGTGGGVGGLGERALLVTVLVSVNMRKSMGNMRHVASARFIPRGKESSN